ncbi:MAG: tRNA (N(6)-L-threonylcarbamoyladenosine(37)-C(2))-methylthiotransferase MtaB [Bacteroidetes bacterium]|nr:tRNA (N(6)-L-threonylcarbamoyladenosine(37)-C(2))-methylthiotransferase MtaB [Bacteroidota bacterium]
MFKTVAFYTLGCKLNFSETSTIARQLESAGFVKTDFQKGADVYVINTCSVTENADKKCSKVVREAHKYNADARVVVIGCYAQLKPDEIANITGVDMVLGASEKFNLVNHIALLGNSEKPVIFNNPIKEVRSFVPGFSAGDRTRSFMKVQDGCDYFCTFCTIPLARGKSRSQTIEKTLETARQVAQTGIKEVVLTGVNIGDFGRENHESFFDLIKKLDTLDGIERFRISSIEPNLLTDEIINFVRVSKKFAPHFHIPLQSGSDLLLEKMRRKYKSKLYLSRVENIKKVMPHCCIGVDVIVGFPGETHELFTQTYNFLKELDISYLHVFPYSERPNTGAVKMEGKVSESEKNKRVQILRELSEKKRHKFYNDNIGKDFTVLYEAEHNNGIMHGYTENYIKIETEYDPLLVNELVKVKLIEINSNMNVVPMELSTCLHL